MKQKYRVFKRRIPRHSLGDSVPTQAEVYGVYMTDMQPTHCADLSPSWYFACLEYRVEGLDDEAREKLEEDLNTTAYEDCGYFYVRDADRFPVLAEREVEIEDEKLEGLTRPRQQVVCLEEAMATFYENFWC